MTFHITREEHLADGLRRIGREQIGIVLAHFDDERLSVDERIHSLRARCKKMRALLRLPGPLMGTRYDDEDGRFRDAGKRLAGFRDAFVLAETLDLIDVADKPPRPNPGPIPTSVIDQSLADMRAALAAVETWALEVEGFCDIAPGFAKTYRKGRAAWDSVCSEPGDEQFHKLRKYSKYHWYQVRILERLNKPVMRKRRVALRELCKLLGTAHDFAMLELALGHEAAQNKKLLQAASAHKHERYRAALEVGRAVFEPSPDRLVADLSRWWADWRVARA